MAFTSFSCIDDVVKKYKLVFVQGPLLPPDAKAPAFSDYFREELAFNLRMLPISPNSPQKRSCHAKILAKKFVQSSGGCNKSKIYSLPIELPRRSTSLQKMSLVCKKFRLNRKRLFTGLFSSY